MKGTASILGLTLIAGFAGGVEPVPSGRFGELHTLIRPQEGEEKWQQIPWLTDLTQARTRAAAEGKPILLWEMDGHPLGCV